MTGRGMAGVVVGLLLSASACGGRNEAAPAGHDAGAGSTGGSTGAGPVAGGQAPAVDGGIPPSPTPPMSPPARTCPAALPPGATWTDVPPPAGLPSGFFVTDAWSAGPDELFFVGADPADAVGDPSAIRRVLHWSGGAALVALHASAAPLLRITLRASPVRTPPPAPSTLAPAPADKDAPVASENAPTA